MDSSYHDQSFDDFSRERHESMDAAQPLKTATTLSVSPPQTQGREHAATRKARTRLWPDHSDDPIHYPSLAQRKLELKGFVAEIVPGRDSGRNMMAIFDDIDATPRTRFTIRCKKGRSKEHWPHYHSVEDVDIPIGTTLKHMCQYYPLHCWADGLRIFMAEGWTAEQMWKQLPADARCDQARERPWNYLQQAMGREADIIYVEAGNNKRVPTKRKRDDADDVAEGAVGDLGGADAQNVSQDALSPQQSPGARSTDRSFRGNLPNNPVTSIVPSSQHSLSPPNSRRPPQSLISNQPHRGTGAIDCVLPMPTAPTAGFDAMNVDPTILTPAESSTELQSQQQPAQHQNLPQYNNLLTTQDIQRLQSFIDGSDQLAPQQHTARRLTRSAHQGLSKPHPQLYFEQVNNARTQNSAHSGQGMVSNPLQSTDSFDRPSRQPSTGPTIGTTQQQIPLQPWPQVNVNSRSDNGYMGFDGQMSFTDQLNADSAPPQKPLWQNDHFPGDDSVFFPQDFQYQNPQYGPSVDAAAIEDPKMVDNGARSFSLTSSSGAMTLPASVDEHGNSDEIDWTGLEDLEPDDFGTLSEMLRGDAPWPHP